MISVEIHGVKAPPRKDAAAHAEWKRTDPIWLLRQCLGNKLRSKHWRSAHHAKKKWIDAYNRAAVVVGSPVRPPALVVVIHALPSCPDIDAPIKVLLDAAQGTVLTSGDDKDIATQLTIREKPTTHPWVRLIAMSMIDEAYECNQLISEAFGRKQYAEAAKAHEEGSRGEEGEGEEGLCIRGDDGGEDETQCLPSEVEKENGGDRE